MYCVCVYIYILREEELGQVHNQPARPILSRRKWISSTTKHLCQGHEVAIWAELFFVSFSK